MHRYASRLDEALPAAFRSRGLFWYAPLARASRSNRLMRADGMATDTDGR